MKRKDIEQLKSATTIELEKRVNEARVKLRELVSQKMVGKLKNTHEITNGKRDIARMLTFINQQIVNGPSRSSG
jgi:ribosomal protein L29